jgi:hypothetical protein
LADVYTDLDTTELRHVKREEELRQFMARIHDAERLPVQDVANGNQRLLIMGDPGSGKSTFMKYLCYVLARAGLAEDPSAWLTQLAPWRHGALLPVRVELRYVAAFARERGELRADAGLLLTQVCQVKGRSCIVSICYQFRAFDFGTTSFQDMVFIVRTGLGSIPRAWYTSR